MLIVFNYQKNVPTGNINFICQWTHFHYNENQLIKPKKKYFNKDE